MDKGSLWTAIAFEGSEYQKASARISFVGGNASFRFGSFGAGINYLPVPFDSIMSAGVNSIGGISFGVSGGAYKFLGFYYDLAVTEALPETGTTEVYNGETITKIADTVGDKYLAAFRRSGYTDKTGSYSVLPAIASAENGEKLTFSAGTNAGAEFTIKDFRLGSKSGSRVGNRLFIEVDFPAAATGTLTYGVKTANGKYVTAEISDPTAGAHKLELFVPDILDVSYFMRSVLFAGSFETETAFTVRKIYIDEYRELLGTPASALRGDESGASIVWNAVEGATKYAVTNPGGTTEEIAATSIKVTQAGLYTVQALSDTLYSKKATVYGEPNYGKLDLTAGGYILGEFDAKGADRNWTTYVGPVPWGTNQTPIIGTGSATNGTMTAQGVTVKALDDANWAAAYYALSETVKVRDAYTIGFNILTPDPWGNCQFNNEIFGVRIGGVNYLAAKGNAFWRKGTKRGSEIVYSAETDFTTNYIGNSNSPVMRVQIVISALGLPAGSENAEIEGVFYGLKKKNTVYVDSIFYTVDGGNAEIKYDGAPVKDKYYTNETFDFTRFTAAVNGGTQSAFKFTATKDGQPFAIPSGETTLEAGEYTINATDRASAIAGSGSVSFTVAPPQSGTLAVSYGKADIFVNETFDMSALAVTGGKEGMTYEYVITLPSGDTAQLTDGYALASGGKYTVTVTGKLRGYVYVGSCEITVAPPQTGTLAVSYNKTVIIVGETFDASLLEVSGGEDGMIYDYVITLPNGDTEQLTDGYAFVSSGKYTVTATGRLRGYLYVGSCEITVYDLLDTPKVSLKGSASGASIVWNAVEGATKYAVTNPGGTTEEIAATSIKVTQAGLYTVQALSDTLYGNETTIYGEPNYGKLDLAAGGYILGEFDAKGADRNWTAYVGPSPVSWGAISSSAPIIGTGSATNGTMTAQGVTIKALDGANWSAGYYALPETVKVRDAYTIGFNILTPDPWSNCQLNNEIFGIRIGGVYYFAGAGNAFWRSGSKKGSEIVFGAEKDFTANYIGNSNSPVMRVQIVISALGLPAGSENAEIEGVFYGLKKKNTVYVDSIFYTVDGGNAEIKYDGAPVKDKYYTNETFDFTRFTASISGSTQSAFKFTATKDGQPFAIPSGETTLEAGEYTITAIDRASAIAGSGSVSFTVIAP